MDGLARMILEQAPRPNVMPVKTIFSAEDTAENMFRGGDPERAYRYLMAKYPRERAQAIFMDFARIHWT